MTLTHCAADLSPTSAQGSALKQPLQFASVLDSKIHESFSERQIRNNKLLSNHHFFFLQCSHHTFCSSFISMERKSFGEKQNGTMPKFAFLETCVWTCSVCPSLPPPTPNWCWTPPQDYFQAVPRLQNNTYHNNKPVNWLSLEEGCKCLPVEESKAVTLQQRCVVFFYDHKFAVWQSNLWFTDLVERRPWHWHSAPCWPDMGCFHNHTFKNKHSWSLGRFL